MSFKEKFIKEIKITGKDLKDIGKGIIECFKGLINLFIEVDGAKFKTKIEIKNYNKSLDEAINNIELYKHNFSKNKENSYLLFKNIYNAIKYTTLLYLESIEFFYMGKDLDIKDKIEKEIPLQSLIICACVDCDQILIDFTERIKEIDVFFLKSKTSEDFNLIEQSDFNNYVNDNLDNILKFVNEYKVISLNNCKK